MALESFLPRLTELVDEAGIAASTEQLQGCLDHLALVIEKNKAMNLTRITQIDDALVLHILDSLLLLPYCNEAPHGDALDMGTGAGFPGIPLALCSDRPWTLLDSVGKKVTAVHAFGDALGLRSCDYVHARLEDHARVFPKRYALIVARAVASLPVLIEYAAPLLQDGGLLVVSKGKPAHDEITAGDRAAELCGLSLMHQDGIELPDDYGTRSILCYQSVCSPRIRLPRANGLAKRQPLA